MTEQAPGEDAGSTLPLPSQAPRFPTIYDLLAEARRLNALEADVAKRIRPWTHILARPFLKIGGLSRRGS